MGMKVSSRKREFEVRLRDGSRALIRPVRPEDKMRIQCGMKLLSPESRYLRFFNGASELSPELLQYLTEVDQENHVAWIAVNPALPGEPGMGIARFIRLPDDPDTAEIALTVVDKLQGIGLGAALLNILLVRAEQLGLRTLRAVVLPDNYRVIRWMRRLGASSVVKDGLIEMNLKVDLAVEGNHAGTHVPELEPVKGKANHMPALAVDG
jgi:RimJ/RimL family protein N-acetyltransferase